MPADRLLLVTSSAVRRGAETEAVELAREVEEHGRTVRVVALHRGDGSTVHALQTLGRTALAPHGLLRLRRLAGETDVVVAYGSTTLPACALALAGLDVPFVYRSIGDPAAWVRGRVHRRITREQFRRPAMVVALWHQAARAIIRIYGVPADRLLVIPNARRADWFAPPTDAERREAQQALSLGEAPTVAFIGALRTEKQVELAISTIAQLPDHRLLVVGEGPERTAAEVLADRTAPGRVRFLGSLGDVRPVLRASDALLITSRTEGMPGAAIEALLMGLPVVATPVGDLPGMPGVTVVAHDPSQLATAMRTASERPPDTEQARRLYSWDRVTPQWLELLDRVAVESPT